MGLPRYLLRVRLGGDEVAADVGVEDLRGLADTRAGAAERLQVRVGVNDVHLQAPIVLWFLARGFVVCRRRR